jgi:2-aminobenzoate-CoA ligase
MRVGRRDLPKATFDAWHAATGIKISTASARPRCCTSSSARRRRGARGLDRQAGAGLRGAHLDDDGNVATPGTVGRLAVRGPTGCRYLADERQKKYVQDGWNVTGDTYLMDRDGYFWYQARSDDMIISAGYTSPAPEVEAALLTHPRSPNAGWSAAPTRSAVRSSRLISCCA